MWQFVGAAPWRWRRLSLLIAAIVGALTICGVEVCCERAAACCRRSRIACIEERRIVAQHSRLWRRQIVRSSATRLQECRGVSRVCRMEARRQRSRSIRVVGTNVLKRQVFRRRRLACGRLFERCRDGERRSLSQQKAKLKSVKNTTKTYKNFCLF